GPWSDIDFLTRKVQLNRISPLQVEKSKKMKIPTMGKKRVTKGYFWVASRGGMRKNTLARPWEGC
ncbi:MAG: hypothetical protein ACREIQ_04305, partial [Nitrospiria bacterium]